MAPKSIVPTSDIMAAILLASESGKRPFTAEEVAYFFFLEDPSAIPSRVSHTPAYKSVYAYITRALKRGELERVGEQAQGVQAVFRVKMKQRIEGCPNMPDPGGIYIAPKQSPEPAVSPPAPEVKKKEALAFQCEVCGALVGSKASVDIIVTTCNGCSAEFMVQAGWAHRLHPGIKLQVWTAPK